MKNNHTNLRHPLCVCLSVISARSAVITAQVQTCPLAERADYQRAGLALRPARPEGE